MNKNTVHVNIPQQSDSNSIIFTNYSLKINGYGFKFILFILFVIYYVIFFSGYLGGRGKYFAITPFTNDKFRSFFIQF